MRHERVSQLGALLGVGSGSDLEEVGRLERGSTNKETVNVGLARQLVAVVGLDRTCC